MASRDAMLREWVSESLTLPARPEPAGQSLASGDTGTGARPKIERVSNMAKYVFQLVIDDQDREYAPETPWTVNFYPATDPGGESWLVGCGPTIEAALRDAVAGVTVVEPEPREVAPPFERA